MKIRKIPFFVVYDILVTEHVKNIFCVCVNIYVFQSFFFFFKKESLHRISLKLIFTV